MTNDLFTLPFCLIPQPATVKNLLWRGSLNKSQLTGRHTGHINSVNIKSIKTKLHITYKTQVKV